MQASLLSAGARQLVLAVWHFLLRTFLPKRTRKKSVDPQRILLINGAHMGDVVIATSLLPVLRSAFPHAEIGFLTATWSNPVAKNHPDVAYTHCVDHWRMNRGKASAFQKRIHYWKTRRRTLMEIRALSYDISVSMHPWRADFLPLAWQAAIPTRVAFRGSPCAPLATVLADYPDHVRFIHQSDCQVGLLRALGIKEEHLRQRRSTLAPSSRQAVSEVCDLLGLARMGDAPYSVIHMGSGNLMRELPGTFWREMTSRLARGHFVLFTGTGAREAANATQAMAGLPNCVNACGRLSWEGFVAAIRHAHTFYGVDSLAAHLAAAVGTKCVAMYTGITNPARFRPGSPSSTVWSNALPCSACGRQFGCAEMTCMKGFDPDRILQIDMSPQLKKATAS